MFSRTGVRDTYVSHCISCDLVRVPSDTLDIPFSRLNPVPRMTVHYVYVKRCSPTLPQRADWGRILITSTSRYVADEFFRDLKVAKRSNGQLRYTELQRETPQFWTFDAGEGEGEG
jgi:hypothetical protein